ncbi:DDT domain-containing protein PTM isoform X2 [Hevea brasiliensis]|nr:DDT domain-containing protein PTM isoform X2 [Hevea brasiliensis]
MGYAKGPEWNGFYDDLLKREYYSLPVSRKLKILQILCDDVLDCAELRAEIDIREESEVGIDPDAVATNLPENGPRRVHPRHSKTSACKDIEAMEIIAESHGTKSSCSSSYLGSKGSEGEGDAPSVDLDGNSDECRLCGMYGTLLCCDSCPSAYHSRCIGVVKMHIPEGPWHCPECTINKLGPTVVMGTSLRGAEIFGVDLYEQVFLGTCNHLLVLRASIGTEPCLRYYNQKDIPKVLQVLSSSVQHRSLYLEISKAIAEYWKIPASVLVPYETMERGLIISSINENEKCSSLSVPLAFNESHKVADTGEAGNVISLNVSNVDNMVVSCLDAFISTTIQAHPRDIISNGDARNCHLMNARLPEQIKVESTGSVNQQIDSSDAAHHSFVDRSSVTTTSTSANSNGSHIGHGNATSLPANASSQSKESDNAGFGRVEKKILMDNTGYMGIFFKPYSYINHYVHGDFAASAAANLAVLSSDESRVSETHKSGNARKVLSDILLQIKAFSTAASRFFWPSFENKLIEVPRERCGWCHSCKLPSNNRRGCMLNSAVLTATKGTMKILSGLRSMMSGEGSLPSISTYILYMGEVLCGLTVGPFVSTSYRKQWRKRIEDASTCSAIKGPLLELEENIRTIALFGDWAKEMDDWLLDSPAIQCSTSTTGTTRKRGPGGKRHKKQSGMSDIRADCCDDKSFVWWRGGKLLKHVFHKASFPQSDVRRAARQGGSRKIFGVYYADDTQLPKRSRQMVWRAAVEKSKNASWLALQVRYLDLHVRWSDLVRPEQNIQDGKGPDTEASFFRNAIICDKKTEENKIRYGVAFGNQKHLPSRIMKNIIEIEQSADGKEKYWFFETHVPLYLLKEYEEKADKMFLPSAKKSLNELSKLQRRQLRATRRDIFLYLAYKRDKLERCSCASCQRDVLLRNTVKCSGCQGYCHKDCTVNSTSFMNEKVEFLITCKQCYNAKAVAHETSNESPTTPLPFQGKESHNILTATKGTRIKLRNQPLISIRAQESSSEMKQTTVSGLATKKKTRSCSWGVIWKKKNTDTGIDFRRENILFKGNSERLKPVCNLCKKPYNRDLMYIHCETCNSWFHAEAVELDESKLPNVVGFKCCRCRRIKSPKCPYDDNFEGEKTVSHKQCERVLKKGYIGVGYDSGTVAESKECEPITLMFPVEELLVQDDDPLLFSISRVEQITKDNSRSELEWNAAGQGPQKLPVRRHTKPQITAEGMFENNHHIESSVPVGRNNLINPKEELPSCVEWDVSTNGLEREVFEGLNYEDMEFEPQTYFSFTELLASDDGDQLDGFDASGNVLGNSENQVCTVSQDGFPEQCAMDISGDQQEPMIASKSTINTKQCKMCSHSEPVPDLSCEVCNLVIHSHCSPWVESSSPEGTWSCGNCQEWQ